MKAQPQRAGSLVRDGLPVRYITHLHSKGLSAMQRCGGTGKVTSVKRRGCMLTRAGSRLPPSSRRQTIFNRGLWGLGAGLPVVICQLQGPPLLYVPYGGVLLYPSHRCILENRSLPMWKESLWQAFGVWGVLVLKLELALLGPDFPW